MEVVRAEGDFQTSALLSLRKYIASTSQYSLLQIWLLRKSRDMRAEDAQIQFPAC